MVDGVSTPPFSASSLGPVSTRTGSEAKVVGQSRERYAEPRHIIEQKVLQWSGMEASLPGQEAAAVPSAAIVPPPAPLEVDPLLAALAAAPTSAPSIQYPAIKSQEELEAPSDDQEYLRIKPERMAAIQSFAASAQAAGKKSNRPAFKHTCSRCGKVFELAIQLDPSRPIYCAECRPLVAEERKNRQKEGRRLRKGPVTPEGEGRARELPSTNRPRLIKERELDLPPLPPSDPNDDSDDLLTSITKAKGQPVELRKQVLEKQAGGPAGDPKKRRKRGGRGRGKGSSQTLAPGQKITFDT
jgi:DNA-directed RNA polymerase subunit RPC12/RpoP